MQSSPFKQIPVLRALIPMIVGIITGINFEIYNTNLLYIPIFFAALLLIFITIRSLRISYKYRWIFGKMLILVFLSLGVALPSINASHIDKDFFGNFLESAQDAIVLVNAPPIEKTSSYKVEVKVKKISNSFGTYGTTGKALIYLKKDSLSQRIKYGDILQVKAAFTKVPPPLNPDEFDYRKYLQFHNFYHQAFFKNDQWKTLDENRGNKFFAFIYQARQRVLDILTEYINDKKDLAVASALIVGKRDMLDAETIQAYSGTGAMHVLAVSGLHVGIVYLILSYSLFFLNKQKNLRQYLKPLLIIVLIWLYACITGLSPSVLRAATMFTFIAFGKMGRRPLNIYGSIAASAFFLLLFNPFFITEVGFLLSYLALTGIIFIQPKIYKLIYFENKLLRKIWMISSVSLAAQIATFPIGLLYFHQFPIYFLVSNLVVIPAATIILVNGLLLIFLSPVPLVADILGMILSHLIHYLNWTIQYIQHLPNALISGIHITIPETFLIYGFIYFIIIFLLHKRKAYLYLSLILILSTTASFTNRTVENLNTKKLIIYCTPGFSNINIIEGKKSILLAPEELIRNDSKMLFHIRHHWWRQGIRKSTEIEYPQALPEYYAIGILGKNRHHESSHMQYLIVNKDSDFKIEYLEGFPKLKLVILDSSIPAWRTEKISLALQSAGIDFYDVNESGAFQLQL